ncbi:hypothetical protein [Ornithinibacillus halophilus]|nr:hypothetical protein [Ornithinibacillus halophilus]
MQQKKILLAVVIILGLGVLVFVLLNQSEDRQAKSIVEEFYLYEQDGAFSESWKLFHPKMEEKFNKGHYIQDRAHVFMNHFGVTTFSFELGSVKKVKDWVMEEGTEAIGEAFVVPVYKTYKGKYGNFTISQDVYATKVDGEWKILWDYNK